ncbi:MAG: NAD(P)/FAD-dependent oxidoreductase [Acidobacteriota bacterium]|nr:NAD(P)/FAD-dependent oxidoreductase [Acidobacteriota bacterium]
MDRLHEVVIIGGGFAGLNAALEMKKAKARITLIDRRNHHLFQPLLYQVATGGLSPADISAPIRALLGKQKNTRVLLGNVVDIDPNQRTVHLEDGKVIDYDSLILATGANHAYFGNDHWEADAPGLKTLEDATRIRHKILLAFEKAELAETPEERKQWLTFAIVGAGPTGVELAGALAELAGHTLRKDFRDIDTAETTIYLLDGSDRVLPTFAADTSGKALKALDKLGVTVRTGVMVTKISHLGATLKTSDGNESMLARTVLWAAGVRASVLGPLLAQKTGAEIDSAGRLKVTAQFNLPGYPDIYVAGDLSSYTHFDGKPLPGTAAVALQQGRYIGKAILAGLKGKAARPFKYIHYGDLAVIGRSAAVADIGKMRLSGHPAWWFWLLVHLVKLVDLQNRMTVLLQWGWSYITRKRSARLITPSSEFLTDFREPPPTEEKQPEKSREKALVI